MLETALIVAAVAQQFRLALTPGQTVDPWPTITLRPWRGIKMVVTRR